MSKSHPKCNDKIWLLRQCLVKLLPLVFLWLKRNKLFLQFIGKCFSTFKFGVEKFLKQLPKLCVFERENDYSCVGCQTLFLARFDCGNQCTNQHAIYVQYKHDYENEVLLMPRSIPDQLKWWKLNAGKKLSNRD